MEFLLLLLFTWGLLQVHRCRGTGTETQATWRNKKTNITLKGLLKIKNEFKTIIYNENFARVNITFPQLTLGSYSFKLLFIFFVKAKNKYKNQEYLTSEKYNKRGNSK